MLEIWLIRFLGDRYAERIVGCVPAGRALDRVRRLQRDDDARGEGLNIHYQLRAPRTPPPEAPRAPDGDGLRCQPTTSALEMCLADADLPLTRIPTARELLAAVSALRILTGRWVAQAVAPADDDVGPVSGVELDATVAE